MDNIDDNKNINKFGFVASLTLVITLEEVF